MLFRILSNSADQHLLDTFLKEHRDSSMFLRSNLHRSGLTYRTEPFHADYMAAIHDGECRAVAAHCWNGTLLLQAPEKAEELAKACVKHSGRKVTAIVGPLEQVRTVRIALGLAGAPAAMDEDEALYALDLSERIVRISGRRRYPHRNVAVDPLCNKFTRALFFEAQRYLGAQSAFSR
jgi:hypothetical protein